MLPSFDAHLQCWVFLVSSQRPCETITSCPRDPVCSWMFVLCIWCRASPSTEPSGGRRACSVDQRKGPVRVVAADGCVLVLQGAVVVYVCVCPSSLSLCGNPSVACRLYIVPAFRAGGFCRVVCGLFSRLFPYARRLMRSCQHGHWRKQARNSCDTCRCGFLLRVDVDTSPSFCHRDGTLTCRCTVSCSRCEPALCRCRYPCTCTEGCFQQPRAPSQACR